MPQLDFRECPARIVVRRHKPGMGPADAEDYEETEESLILSCQQMTGSTSVLYAQQKVPYTLKTPHLQNHHNHNATTGAHCADEDWLEAHLAQCSRRVLLRQISTKSISWVRTSCVTLICYQRKGFGLKLQLPLQRSLYHCRNRFGAVCSNFSFLLD